MLVNILLIDSGQTEFSLMYLRLEDHPDCDKVGKNGQDLKESIFSWFDSNK